MMPSEIEATVATEKPTSPTSNAQAPNVVRIGKPFGIRLSAPRRTLRSENIMMTAMAAIARIVPTTMFCMLRSEM